MNGNGKELNLLEKGIAVFFAVIDHPLVMGVVLGIFAIVLLISYK